MELHFNISCETFVRIAMLEISYAVNTTFENTIALWNYIFNIVCETCMCIAIHL